MSILVFDVETTGKANFKKPAHDPGQPRVVQLAALLATDEGVPVSHINYVIRPEGFSIPEEAANLHGITTEIATEYGVSLKIAMASFTHLLGVADVLVAFNIEFDKFMIEGEMTRLGRPSPFFEGDLRCSMLGSRDICKLSGGRYGEYKWPKLEEAYRFFFHKDFEDAHDAMADVRATLQVHLAIERWHQQQAAQTPQSNEKQKKQAPQGHQGAQETQGDLPARTEA